MERGDLLVVRHFSQYLHRLLDMQKVRPLPSGWPVFNTYKIVLAKQADESVPMRDPLLGASRTRRSHRV